MDTSTPSALAGLSPRQLSILYALVRQMIDCHEIDLTGMIERDRQQNGDPGQPVRAIALTVLDRLDQTSLPLGLGRAWIIAGKKLLTSRELPQRLYLAKHLPVESSTLFFPEVSVLQTDTGDGEDDDTPPAARVLGDLRLEFPDATSRQALIAGLEHWTSLDLAYVPAGNNTLAKVRAVLAEPVPEVLQQAKPQPEPQPSP